MKTRTTLLLLLLLIMISSLILSCKKAYQPIPKLSGFVIHDRYSDLYEALTANREIYNKSSLILYDIILNSMTNKPLESNQLIDQFRKQFTTVNDTVNYYLIQTEYNNYVKLSDYRKLKEIGGMLIDKYQAFVDSSDYIELKDDHIRYSFLENEKPIQLNKLDDTKVRVKKDIAGYTLLCLKSNNDSTMDFIFDTGANVNTITESAARKLNLRVIPNSTIHVMGVTGARNEALIGIADKITLGNMEMQNVEFVIFADSLFTFAGGKYVINGTVGFPIFSRFEEITYTDSTLFVPKTPSLKPGESNMFIKLDDYILSVGYKGKKYSFFFDTGNMNSYFTSEFYKIDSTYFKTLKDTILTYTGIGGSTNIKAKQPPEVILNFAGKDFKLIKPFVEVESEHRNKFLYGSIGKDFMGMYKTRIMSFKEARIEFE